MTHTAGFPLNLPNDITSQQSVINYLSNWKATAPIGSQWQYSNVGIGLAGYVLEVVTHENYNQMYRGKILGPLGMEPIALIVPNRYKVNLAQGHDDNGNVMPSVQQDLFPSAYAFKASANDMRLFLAAAIGLPQTPTNIKNAMQLTQTPFVNVADWQQGLGWEIHSLDNTNKLLNPTETNLGPLPAAQLEMNQQIYAANRLIDKTGMTNGFRTYIAVIPSQKSGIVILANKNMSGDSIIKLGREILLTT